MWYSKHRNKQLLIIKILIQDIFKTYCSGSVGWKILIVKNTIRNKK